MAKKKLQVEVGSLNVETTAVEVVKTLQHYIDKYGEEVFIEEDYYPYSGGSRYWSIKAMVLETDEQETLREKQEEIARQQIEATERATLERLQNKYQKS